MVPELASRQHIRDLTPVLERAVGDCGMGLEDLDAVAVTYGPGLAGALLTGLNAAKAIAWSLDVPLLGVNHLEGHIYASWLTETDPEADPGFPLACLVASGGHTDLLLMQGHGDYRLVGRTRDDAAGEAFDKAARILGLGFPGGPEIQRVTQGGADAPEGEREGNGATLPRAWLRDTLDFSFSGVQDGPAASGAAARPLPGAAGRGRRGGNGGGGAGTGGGLSGSRWWRSFRPSWCRWRNATGCGGCCWAAG